ncbi:hypothetical protein ACFX1Z_040991 [Malus domestica]
MRKGNSHTFHEHLQAYYEHSKELTKKSLTFVLFSPSGSTPSRRACSGWGEFKPSMVLQMVDSSIEDLMAEQATEMDVKEMGLDLVYGFEGPGLHLMASTDSGLLGLQGAFGAVLQFQLVQARSVGVAFYARVDQKRLVPCCSFSSCRQ